MKVKAKKTQKGEKLMKKTFLKKMISAGIIAATMCTMAPLGVSALEKEVSSNWKQSSDSTWSYCIGNTPVKGWKNISNIWYYFDNNGKMKTGWINDAGKWYYADNTGAMQTGILKISGNVYCLNKSGVMQTGSVKIGNKNYQCNINGQVSGSETPKVDKGFDSNNNLIKPNENSNKTESTGNSGSTNKPTATETDKGSSTNSNSTVNNSTSNNVLSGGNSVTVSGLPQLSEKYSVTVQSNAESKILELMNAKRTEAGLKPLSIDYTLQSVARYKSNHMIQNGYFNHVNPDGTKWTNWLNTIGYKYNSTAENIAYNTNDPVELFNQWWNSAGHRENMMNPSYTKVGIGVLLGNGKYMGTQTFAG
ncbi:CAP domain-containing protein [Clostridium butyricum]|uniref:CAP domain-containing protein n=1 Tax=Clostridium butyricum TaxID=1492 RepID=UPI0002CA98A6|nr:CAP domain-containing protein [Clostridium butyricum]EMU55605.1 hypothetical protein CBDKU1_04800 [Clostridium butyricum DKU-01]